MEENHAILKIFPTKSFFFEKENRANLLLFSKFGAALVYLSGESRPSLACSRQRMAED